MALANLQLGLSRAAASDSNDAVACAVATPVLPCAVAIPDLPYAEATSAIQATNEDYCLLCDYRTITGIAFSPDGRKIAYIRGEHEIRVRTLR